MACWLGGLVVLCVAVLPKRDVDELRVVLPRYSALALGAIVALIVSGGYQAWRQVGSIDALKSTDYGKLLIAKLVVFAALIVAAAFSREIVNRRFRDLPLDEDTDRRRAGAGRCGCDRSVRRPNARAAGSTTTATTAPGTTTTTTDEEEVRRLRRSVADRGGDRRGHPRHHRAPGERGAGPVGGDRSRWR